MSIVRGSRPSTHVGLPSYRSVFPHLRHTCSIAMLLGDVAAAGGCVQDQASGKLSRRGMELPLIFREAAGYVPIQSVNSSRAVLYKDPT